MQLRQARRQWSALLLALLLTLGATGMVLPRDTAWAQTPHKKNFAQRHPNLTSAAAGYAAYKVAKTTGKNRQRAGRKKNFAQRHPILTGVGAAVATHHVIKKSEKNR